MSTINQLPTASRLNEDDVLPVWQTEHDSTRKATVADIASRVSELIEGEPDETQYSLPVSGSSFAILVVPLARGSSVWAQITLAGNANSGTITLPLEPDRGHGQEVLVTLTGAVASLTVNAGDALVHGEPAQMAPHGFFRMRYDAVSNAWYRVG